MKKRLCWLYYLVVVAALVSLSGCAGNQQGYQKAFDTQFSLTQNQASFQHPSETVFKIVKQTFTQQGFTIESADLKSGVVKAIRNMDDKTDSEISYNIHVSADISEVAGAETNVSVAASQQTILHRSTTTWWHLLWILPIIPTGTEYQTLVIKEGNITEPQFYTDFFNSLRVSVTKYEVAVKAAAAKAAEKAAILKAEAEAKAAAERAAAEKAAAEKAAAERVAAEKAAAEKAAAERVAAEKAAAEKAAKAKAEAEAKAAAEKAEAERMAAENAARAKAEAETKAGAAKDAADKPSGKKTDLPAAEKVSILK